MACEEFRDVMLDVLYGESDAAAARAFETHQHQCAECRSELGALRALRRDLREWAIPAPAGWASISHDPTRSFSHDRPTTVSNACYGASMGARWSTPERRSCGPSSRWPAGIRS